MSPTVARTGLLTFAALATVALLIGLTATERPCQVEPCPQDHGAQEPRAALPDDSEPPDHSRPADPAPTPSPPEDAEPTPSPPDVPQPTPAPPDHAEPTPSPPADPQPTPAPPDHAEPTPSPPSAEGSTPVSTPTVDVDAAGDYVRAFYADLEARQFRAAWPRLAEDLRERHGSLEAWVSGFETTVRQSASDFVATAAGPATVRVTLTLTAVDRDKHDCEVTRRFAVLWRLDLMSGKWRALHAEAKALKPSPAAVAASC